MRGEELFSNRVPSLIRVIYIKLFKGHKILGKGACFVATDIGSSSMISQFERFLTKVFSSFIFPILKARDIVTASGSLSRTATTIVTAIMKALTTSLKVSRH